MMSQRNISIHSQKTVSYSDDAAGLGRRRAAVFILPSCVLLGLFALFPALWTIALGMTNYELTGTAAAHMTFIGSANYVDALKDPQFYNSIRLSMLFVFCSGVIGQSFLGLVIAWYLRTIPRGFATLLETLIIVAWIIPASVNAFIWFAMYQGDRGTINAIFGTDKVWLVQYPMLSIIIFNMWVGVAFSVLQYRSALVTVPKGELESARLYGANGFQQFRDVVLPHIRRNIVSNLLLVVLSTFNTFTPYLLTMGGPDGESNILPAYIYNTALGQGELGRGSAISAALLLINLIFFMLIRRTKRGK